MLYNYGKKMLEKYENDENGAIKSFIILHLCWSCFKNADLLPSKVEIPINLKKYIGELREYRKKYGEDKKYVHIWEYSEQMIDCVLSDLELDYTSLYVVGHRGFNYTFEVGFPKATIEKLQNM